MLDQYIQHIFADPVLVSCCALMTCLFLYDCFGLVSESAGLGEIRHTDFKAPIMSIGIFGTFLGILNGLYEFNPSDITRSVPFLLEGLKFAFATSVLGMFLTVILSVIHKMFGKTEDESQILNSIDTGISSLDSSMRSLAASIESPQELIRQFSQMQDFLKEELAQINTSLDQALVELAKGATQEVINALREVVL